LTGSFGGVRRLAATIALAALAAALLAACGGSSTSETSGTTGSSPNPSGASAPAGASARSCETKAVAASQLRATAVSCGEARGVMLAWQRQNGCAAAAGASHSACTVRGYRCIGTVASAGLAVSCAQQGHAIAFIAKRG
jgi:hypothetical protein